MTHALMIMKGEKSSFNRMMLDIYISRLERVEPTVGRQIDMAVGG